MIVGILKEIKTKENRVSMTPAGVEQMIAHGHTVLVEKGAGRGSNYSNKDYSNSGAEICKSAEEVYRRAEMIMKVKEPLPVEFPMIRNGQIIFTYIPNLCTYLCFRTDKRILRNCADCINNKIILFLTNTIDLARSRIKGTAPIRWLFRIAMRINTFKRISISTAPFRIIEERIDHPSQRIY